MKRNPKLLKLKPKLLKLLKLRAKTPLKVSSPFLRPKPDSLGPISLLK
jgi:hypothetical protein